MAQAITRTRGSRIDGRTTRHPGYAVSLRLRKRIDEGFGGWRMWRRSPRSSCAARRASIAPSSSRSPPTTSCACRSCWPRPRRERADGMPAGRPLADRRDRALGSRLPRPPRTSHAQYPRRGMARSPSERSRPASTSPMGIPTSPSTGRAATKWTKSGARAPPNSSTTSSSKPFETLPRQPAKGRHRHNPDIGTTGLSCHEDSACPRLAQMLPHGR